MIAMSILICSVYGSVCDGPIKAEVITCANAWMTANEIVARTQLMDDKHYLKVTCGRV